MRVLVTSGGTTEYIDDVRVLTNISTGRLGALIATELGCARHDVTYVAPQSAVKPAPYDYRGEVLKRVQRIEITDVASLMEVMKVQVPKHDVVIHAMAVSDFGFKREGAIKLKSNDPEAFIDSMRARIQTNPKIISYIKTWNPNCKLIGFKFEVGKTYAELADIACESMMRNNCDAVIANDKEEMKREQQHIAYWIDHDAYVRRSAQKYNGVANPLPIASIRLAGKEEIAKKLVSYVAELH